MPARQQTASAQLGTLLLRGHTMLAESCPSCNVPLMRDPATLQSQCVGCQRYFSPAEVQALNNAPHHEELPAPAEPPGVSGPLHAAATSAQAAAAFGVPPTRAMNGPLTSALARHHRRTTSNGGSSDGAGSPNLMPAQAPVTPAGAAAAGTLSPASQSTTSSAAAGAAGTGTGASAAASGQLTPRMAHSQDATDDEVLQAYQQIRAERQRDERQQHQQAHHTRHQQPQQPQAIGAVGGGAAAATPRQHADVSQLMADKMLAGWALLGDHCPICSTPLMRERGTRQVYCVACNLPVRVEQQHAPNSGASTDRSTQGAAAASPQPPAAAAAGGQDREQQPQQNGPIADEATPGADAAPLQAAAAGVTGAAAATRGGSVVAAAPVTPAGLRAFVAQRNRQSEVAAAAASVAAGHGVGDVLSKQQVLSDLHQALLKKLHEARQHLLAIPASQHEQMGQQLQLIQQLLQTLTISQQ